MMSLSLQNLIHWDDCVWSPCIPPSERKERESEVKRRTKAWPLKFTAKRSSKLKSLPFEYTMIISSAFPETHAGKCFSPLTFSKHLKIFNLITFCDWSKEEHVKSAEFQMFGRSETITCEVFYFIILLWWKWE